MVKILAIGDFHGKFPEKLKKIAKSKDIDLIVSTGDFADADKIRRIIFKNWTDKKWYEAVGFKKARELEKESFYSGLKILKELNKFNKPAFIIWGNTDFYKEYTTSEPSRIMPGFYNERLTKLKNIKLIHKKKYSKDNLEIFGHGGYVDVTEFIKNPIDKDEVKQKKRLKRYNKDEQKIINLFKNKKPKKDFIFLIHYTPLGIFDKVKYPGSPMNGKHVGWEPYNKIIKKYKPSLVISGHMHEYQGKKKINNSVIVATGAAHDGKAAIIGFDEVQGKIKNIKFIK
jgi:Icc-related predicted phosphoesterase